MPGKHGQGEAQLLCFPCTHSQIRGLPFRGGGMTPIRLRVSTCLGSALQGPGLLGPVEVSWNVSWSGQHLSVIWESGWHAQARS